MKEKNIFNFYTFSRTYRVLISVKDSFSVKIMLWPVLLLLNGAGRFFYLLIGKEKIKKFYLAKPFFIFSVVFFSQFVWSTIQYKPLSSNERHELSFGFSVSKDNWRDNLLLKNLPSGFFIYTAYLSEIPSAFIGKPYSDIFIPGFQVGTNVFRKKNPDVDYGLCSADKASHSFAYHFGLKGKSAYFESLQPFVGWGLARSFCLQKLSKISKSKMQLGQYVSYGLNLSLKILDKDSIYTLDQEYGINDIGLNLGCIHYYPKKTENKSFQICQVGLLLSF